MSMTSLQLSEATDDDRRWRMEIVELLTKLGEEGAVALIKIDGVRASDSVDIWTFVVSGPPLGESFVRVDASSPEECVSLGLLKLREIVPKWSWIDELTI